MLGAVLVAATLWSAPLTLTKPRWVPPAGLFGGAAPQFPHATNSPAPTQAPVTGSRSVSGWVIVVIVAIIAAVILLLVLRYLRGHPRRIALPAMGSLEDLEAAPAATEVEQEPDAPTVHRGLQVALDALDEAREPADAVVRAWLGLQAAAEDSGVERRGAETPTEFTARVITRVQADGGAAMELVNVYQTVRFGAHPITTHEVNEARAAIRKLLASWHDPVAGRAR